MLNSLKKRSREIIRPKLDIT